MLGGVGRHPPAPSWLIFGPRSMLLCRRKRELEVEASATVGAAARLGPRLTLDSVQAIIPTAQF